MEDLKHFPRELVMTPAERAAAIDELLEMPEVVQNAHLHGLVLTILTDEDWGGYCDRHGMGIGEESASAS